MPPVMMSSIVFVGEQFPRNMFDEREVFGGKLDEDGQIKIGPVGQFRYSRGMYTFDVTPNRIDLKAFKQEIMPEEITEAAKLVGEKLDQVRIAIPVKGVGLNCDIAYDRTKIGMSGNEYCATLGTTKLVELAGTNDIQSFSRMRFQKGSMIYDIRIEPEINSEGEKLYIAVNGHQNVEDEPLSAKFKAIGEFRDYIEKFDERFSVKK